jgi:cysteinyl-tRNA synthetase
LKSGKTDAQSAQRLVDDSADILAPSLDKKVLPLTFVHSHSNGHQDGASVTDPSLSRSLARFWEEKFFEDMARLRVKEPDTLTRVTEYVPEIVAFVERIVQNGYAYEAGGSVYFDTNKFDSHEGHTYAKLEPWSKGNKELLEEGEGRRTPSQPTVASLLTGRSGALSNTTGRRSAADFALWKASKPGEPFWPSPWGQGRPGWHIECSVMASAILGDNIDVHSGGIDLAFPHHDNEIAQAEVIWSNSIRHGHVQFFYVGLSWIRCLGQLLPSHWSPTYRGFENEQVPEEFHHDRCKYLVLTRIR